MNQTIVFIYNKDGQITYLTHKESLERNDELIKNHAVYRSNLDSWTFVRYVHNELKDVNLIEEIKSYVSK